MIIAAENRPIAKKAKISGGDPAAENDDVLDPELEVPVSVLAEVDEGSALLCDVCKAM